MVNAALPKALGLGNAQLVGSRIRMDGGPWVTVTGVVADARQVLTEPVYPEVLLPLSANVPASASLLLRARQGAPLSLAPGLRSVVRQAGTDVALANVYPMSAIVDGYLPAPFIMAFGILSVVALFFGGLGLYAVVAFQVARRSREFGLRMALGADARRILGIILGEALRLTGAGVAFGAVAGLGVGRFLSARFLDVRLADPYLIVGVPVLLSVVTLLASLLPGRRAVRGSPAVVLRQL
jgi:putative ABC transport system permease protein